MSRWVARKSSSECFSRPSKNGSERPQRMVTPCHKREAFHFHLHRLIGLDLTWSSVMRWCGDKPAIKSPVSAGQSRHQAAHGREIFGISRLRSFEPMRHRSSCNY
jgi:hypothetical protein